MRLSIKQVHVLPFVELVDVVVRELRASAHEVEAGAVEVDDVGVLFHRAVFEAPVNLLSPYIIKNLP